MANGAPSAARPEPPLPRRPRTRARCRRAASAPARRRRTHRREHVGQRLHSARHLAAHHRRQGDGREPPHHQPAPHPRRHAAKSPSRTSSDGPSSKRWKKSPALNHAYAERDGQPYPRGAPANQPRHRHRRRRQGRRAQPDGAQHQERRRAQLPGIPHRLRRPGGARPHAPNSPPPISRAPPFRSPTPAPSAPCRRSPRLMPGQGAIIAAGAIDYPAEYRGAADETRAMLGISKVMTLTCTYDHRIIQGAESGAFLGKRAGPARRRGRLLRRDLRRPAACRTCRCAGRPTASRVLPGMNAARHAEIAKEAGDHADDQRLSRARPPDRRSRPARRRAQLPRRTRPRNLRPHHLGSRPRIPHRHASAKHRRRRPKPLPRCAKFWRPCARPTAAKSAAST